MESLIFSKNSKTRESCDMGKVIMRSYLKPYGTLGLPRGQGHLSREGLKVIKGYLTTNSKFNAFSEPKMADKMAAPPVARRLFCLF